MRALSLHAGHVGQLVRELAPLVNGLVVREVIGAPPRDLVLCFWEPTRTEGAPTWRVLVSADPDAARIHVALRSVARHTGPLGPFFRVLQHDLDGATLRKLTQVAGDRIVAFEFDTRGGERRTLIAELVGRHANMVLLTGGDRVAALLVPAPSGKTDARLVVNHVYAPPPGRPPSGSDADLTRDFPKPSSPPPARRDGSEVRVPLSWIVENALGGQALETTRARELKQLVERATRKLERALGLVRGLEQRLHASAQHERVRNDGELLKANLHALLRGAKSVELEDYFAPEGGPRTIALDPRLSPQENVQRVFERAKKLARARELVAEELARAQDKVAQLEQLLARAKEADADLAALERDAVERGLLDPPQEADVRKQKAPEPRLPYRAFVGAKGASIKVGRGAKDNDELTFRHARGNDVWLHTADTPGSHVILGVEKNAEPDHEELLDAAHLAVHFSPIAGATRARVHVARRKEVHKPRGAKPGLVTLSGGKILELRLQQDRLQRLLDGPTGPRHATGGA